MKRALILSIILACAVISAQAELIDNPEEIQITTTPVNVLASVPWPSAVLIRNIGSRDLYLGGSTTTALLGLQMKPGEVVTIDAKKQGLYAVTSADTTKVRVVYDLINTVEGFRFAGIPVAVTTTSAAAATDIAQIRAVVDDVHDTTNDAIQVMEQDTTDITQVREILDDVHDTTNDAIKVIEQDVTDTTQIREILDDVHDTVNDSVKVNEQSATIILAALDTTLVYDATLTANRVTEVNPIYNHRSTSPQQLITSAQDFTESWADLGDEVLCDTFSRIGLYLNLDINDSAGMRIKALGKHTLAHADEFEMPIYVGSTTDVTIDNEYYEFVTETDQKIYIEFDCDAALTILQFQIQVDRLRASAAQVDSAVYVLGGSGR